MSSFRVCLSLILTVIVSVAGFSQQSLVTNKKFQSVGLSRVITTAVPFLTLAPDARSGAMGDAGVALSPDANASHWNSGKLAFLKKKMGASISYNPWLRKLVNDMSLNYLTGYYKPSEQEAISFNLLYFDLGNITFTDNSGNVIKEFRPSQFSSGLSYSRKLSEHLGVGLGLKFIYSNLTGNLTINNSSGNQVTKPGATAAGDVGIYYRNDYLIGGKNTNIAFGANISDLGAKISYSNSSSRNFIPTNLRIGTAVTTELDPYNTITFTVDANKLMVPSPQILKNSAGGDSLNAYGTPVGVEPTNKPLLSGIMGSFTDAPGGFKQELQEIILNFGLEYWYHDAQGNPLFAIRGGYYYENPYTGNRKYFTMGFGFRYEAFGIDFAYLVPVQQNNPLSGSLRFTLHYSIEGQQKTESITE